MQLSVKGFEVKGLVTITLVTTKIPFMQMFLPEQTYKT